MPEGSPAAADPATPCGAAAVAPRLAAQHGDADLSPGVMAHQSYADVGR
jgi:hypothetical protein